MFDDVIEPEKKENGLSQSNAQVGGNGQSVPAVQSFGSSASYPEDIFAEGGAEEKPAVLQPKVSAPLEIGPIEHSRDNTKKLLILSGLILSFLLFCLAGYWSYGYFTNSKGDLENLNQDAVIVDNGINQGINSNDIDPSEIDREEDLDYINNNNEQNLDVDGETNNQEPLIPLEPNGSSTDFSESSEQNPTDLATGTSPNIIVDTDQDGLTDEVELGLGTNINSVDSDHDGLFDLEEVVTYKTDPLNPDTDNDTYLDGQEVKAGYNPKGDGRL